MRHRNVEFAPSEESAASSIRGNYEKFGVVGYYSKHGNSYSNPHYPEIQSCLKLVISDLKVDSVLDLACGSGEVTKFLKDEIGNEIKVIESCDPFTQEAFKQRLGYYPHNWSFQDIADGVLESKEFDLCVSSFALHLMNSSQLFSTLFELANRCKRLLILSPNKHPLVKSNTCWELERHFVHQRVHVRLYRSLIIS
jgi:SAM-dependent methyltransferase